MLQTDFEAMKVTRRVEGQVVRPRPAVLSPTPISARGRCVLVVDEITTSRDTLRLALATVREVRPVRTATSFVRPGGYRPDFFAMETDALVVFPWDKQIIERGQLVTGPMYASA